MIERFDYKEFKFNDGLLQIKIRGKFGYINDTGKIVIPPRFDYARSFYEGLAAVCIDGKWGFIDTFGQIIIPFYLDGVDHFSNGLVWAQKDYYCGYLNRSGKSIIPHKYLSAPYAGYSNFNEDGFAIVVTSDISNNLLQEKGWKYAFVVLDKKGNELVKITAGYVYFFDKRTISFSGAESGCGTVDVFTKKIKFISRIRLAWPYNGEGNFALIDSTGNCNNPNNKVCIYNKVTGKIYETRYKHIFLREHSFQATNYDDGYRILDYDFKQLVPTIFDYCTFGYSVEGVDQYIVGLKINDSSKPRGVISQRGDTIIPLIHISIDTLNPYYYPEIYGGYTKDRLLYYDKTGKIIFEFGFKDVTEHFNYEIVTDTPFYKLKITNKSTNEWKIHDFYIPQIVPQDKIEYIDSNKKMFPFKDFVTRKIGIKGIDNKVFIEPKYDEFCTIKDNFHYVRDGDNAYFIDNFGNNINIY